MKFLDTNVILRYLTADDPRKARQCELLFERAERGREPLYTTSMVIAEVVWVLSAQYGHPKGRVADGVRRLLNTRGILIEEREALLLTLQLFERHAIDFIDAYNAAVMHVRGIGVVYSYDHGFDVIPGLERLEP